jgi:hypothetical protein
MIDFDLSKFEGKAFLSDQEVYNILISGAFVKTGNKYHTIYKRNVISFTVRDGVAFIHKFRKVPCVDYSLPIVDNTVSFSKRAACYLELENLEKNRTLDDGNFKIYGT